MSFEKISTLYGAHRLEDLEHALIAAQNSAARDTCHADLDEAEAHKAFQNRDFVKAQQLRKRARTLRKSAAAYEKEAQRIQKKINRRSL